MFLLGTAVFAAQGPLARLYAHPISNSSLVAWHMFPAMLAVWLGMLASIWALNGLFDLRWPLWGPALFAATAMAASQAAIWMTDRSAWMVLSLAAVLSCLGLWFKSRYGGFYQTAHYWTNVQPHEVLTLAAITGLAYAGAIAGVSRNRRGDPPLSLGVVRGLRRALQRAPRAVRPLHGPLDAQLWYEWRHKGLILPTMVGVALVFGIALWLIVDRDPQHLMVGLLAGGGYLTAAGFLVGLLLGGCSSTDKGIEMSQFLATRPITTSELANALLRNMGRTVVTGWLVWTAAVAACGLLFSGQDALRPLTDVPMRWWSLPATLLGVWSTVALSAALNLAGRAQLTTRLVCGTVGIFIAALLLVQFLLSREAQQQLFRGAAVASGVLLVLATGWALYAAWRRALIGTATVYVAVALWVALTLLARFAVAATPLPWSGFVFLAGLLALPLAPLALAPLALAWNRTR
jgi:hypothetical protein